MILLFISNDAIKRLILPYVPLSHMMLYKFMCSIRLPGVAQLFQRKRVLGIQYEVNMVVHHNIGVEVIALCVKEPQRLNH